MTRRISSAVTRGEIDNRVEGMTIGRVWLAGRGDPIELWLAGDCWRDLAGTCLHFRNRDARPCADALALAAEQRGVVGDMTASRRIRVPMKPGGPAEPGGATADESPIEWRNELYLEWFCERDCRVLIESSAFELRIGDRDWTMDADAEAAQKLANMHAMRDFVATILGRRDESADGVSEQDEYVWEERLKESDRLTDAHQQVLEKYLDDPDSARKEAFVMGWDGLLDALAELDESFAGDTNDVEVADRDEMDFGCGEFFEETADDDDFWADCEPGAPDPEEKHPLQARAREVASRATDLVGRAPAPGTPAQILVACLMEVSGKMAAALNGRGSGYEPETGYVLAQLKRCLNWLNEALGACQELIDHSDDGDERAALDHLRSSCFEIRDAINDLRRELKP